MYVLSRTQYRLPPCPGWERHTIDAEYIQYEYKQNILPPVTSILVRLSKRVQEWPRAAVAHPQPRTSAKVSRFALHLRMILGGGGRPSARKKERAKRAG